jgi:hypothetical protein
MSIFDRFYKKIKINKENECWEWQGCTRGGYGRFALNKSAKSAHRISYYWHKGFIEENHVVMHLCDNRRCVNPDHLRSATQKENVHDCINKNRNYIPKRKSYCKNGHEYTEENIFYNKPKMSIGCVSCRKIRDKKRRPRKNVQLSFRSL